MRSIFNEDSSKDENKRNTYNYRDTKRNSTNALLSMKKHPQALNVSVERSSGRIESQHDESNGDQGTRIDSPLNFNVTKKSSSQNTVARETVAKINLEKVNEFGKPITGSIKDLLKSKPQKKVRTKKVSSKNSSRPNIKRKKIKLKGGSAFNTSN